MNPNDYREYGKPTRSYQDWLDDNSQTNNSKYENYIEFWFDDALLEIMSLPVTFNCPECEIC